MSCVCEGRCVGFEGLVVRRKGEPMMREEYDTLNILSR